MSKRVDIVVVAYALADDLLRLYESIRHQSEGQRANWHVYLHSRHPAVVDAVTLMARDDRVNVQDFGVNRGLARSWNDGWLWATACESDYVFIANDDALAAPDDLGKLIAAADAAPDDVYMVTGMGFDARHGQRRDQLFSLALMRPVALRQIGMFDVNFAPIYWEDIDYYRRADLLGLRHVCVEDTDIFHAGSKSLFEGPQGDRDKHDGSFHANRRYYEAKWGGGRGQEVFTHPFNDAACGLRIAPGDREFPYPTHPRIDVPF